MDEAILKILREKRSALERSFNGHVGEIRHARQQLKEHEEKADEIKSQLAQLDKFLKEHGESK